jgi:GMP reductase
MMNNILFDFNDVLLMPSKTSSINSRSEVDARDGLFLPIIAAPMDTVVSEGNYRKFLDFKLPVCLPRGEKGDGYIFESYSLHDIIKFLPVLEPTGRYLIDVANGHMSDLIDAIKTVKTQYPQIKLMVGNVANPETYEVLSDAGADYIRVGIGNGNGCLTTQQTAVGYPMGSLIKSCYEKSINLTNPAKIVADGGMKSYSDIIKALALGADFVMVGSLLNKAIESAGSNYIFKYIPVSQKMAEWCFKLKLPKGKKIPVYKKFRGMSTKEVQKKWGRKELKTSEGVVRVRRVEYTLKSWTENAEDYLKSAMSYCNARTLDEFKGQAKYNLISQNAFLRFKK